MSRTYKDKPPMLRWLDDGIPVTNRTTVEYSRTSENNYTHTTHVHGKHKVGREAKKYILEEFKSQNNDVTLSRNYFHLFVKCDCSWCGGSTPGKKRAERRNEAQDAHQQVIMVNSALKHGEDIDTAISGDMHNGDDTVSFNHEDVMEEDTTAQYDVDFHGSYSTETSYQCEGCSFCSPT